MSKAVAGRKLDSDSELWKLLSKAYKRKWLAECWLKPTTTMSLNKCLLFALLAIVASASVSAERVRYDNYRMYKVNSENAKQLEVLKDLEGSSDSIMFLDGVHLVGADIQIIVAPHKVPDFLEILGKSEIKYELQSRDVQKSLDEIDEKVAIKDVPPPPTTGPSTTNSTTPMPGSSPWPRRIPEWSPSLRAARPTRDAPSSVLRSPRR